MGVRKQGWWLTNQKLEVGLLSMATPIRDPYCARLQQSTKAVRPTAQATQ